MSLAAKSVDIPDLVVPRRALLSVFDKTGLENFAAELHRRGCMLISTGGTKRSLEAAGLPVTDVSEITGFAEILDGRVKTLHPMVHGGLLGQASDPDHAKTMKEHGIASIDLLVSNLYPFEKTVEAGADYATAVAGLRLAGVVEGGPAEAAGLRAGDVLVEFAGQQIANIYDYTYALDAVKIGEAVRVVYLRDGERRELAIVPEARR